jgi:hypothetical protein
MILVLVSRIPFLDAGCGTDPDAWRVVSAAQSISRDVEYRPSRLPGYPVQEYFYSLISSQPPFVLNLCTAILSSLAAAFFALIIHGMGSKDAILAALAFACTPIVYISSTTSMDYLWALSMVLGSLFCLQNRKPSIAGFLLGIAVGCRISSLIFVVPCSLLIRDGESFRKHSVHVWSFVLSTTLVSVFAYVPVFRRYGFGFLTFFQHGYPSLGEIIKTMTIDIWGLLGTGAILAALMYSLIVESMRKDRASHSTLFPLPMVAASASSVLLVTILFLRLPLEAGYLIPAVPFVLLLLAHRMNRGLFRVVCALLIISSFTGSIDSGDRPWSPVPSAASVRLTLNGRHVVFDPLKGPIVNDHERRITRMQFVNNLLAFGDSVATRSVIVAGVWLPQITISGGDCLSENEEQEFTYNRRKASFVGLLDSSAVERYRRSGTPIFFVTSQEVYNREMFGIDLRAIGALEIN